MAAAIATIGIVGAGAWGTALAQLCAERGHGVVIWAHEPETAEAINTRHENPVFLPGIALDPVIRASRDLAAIAGRDAILMVTPAQHTRAVARALAPHLGVGAIIVACSKGIEAATGMLMTEVLAETLPGAVLAVLSGPTLAGEVARGKPAAATVASADAGVAQALVAALGSSRFRPYAGTDPIGAEIGGAVKNVIAIACGAVTGLGLGNNARAALLTRGLAEMTRLARAKGGQAATLMGLAGIGDLVLTCTSEDSRNYSFGVALGQGRRAADLLDGRHTVAEGAHSARPLVELAARFGVDMPIVAAVDQVVNGGADLRTVTEELLSRPFRAEGAAG